MYLCWQPIVNVILYYNNHRLSLLSAHSFRMIYWLIDVTTAESLSCLHSAGD